MAITYHAGRRIQGTETDRVGSDAISGGWKEVGRTTLGSAGDALTVSSFADKRYYMVLYNAIPSGELTEYMTMGSSGTKDTGSNYVTRVSQEGGSDSTYTSRANIVFAAKSGATQPEFGVSYIANKSDKEKLLIGHSSNAVTAGAGTVPDRSEFVAKHVQTSNPLDVVSFDNTGSGDFASGSECVVLGYDPDDTHTDNFWEELANVTTTSSADFFSSGTITAKKYLWVQAYVKQASPYSTGLQFNSDTANNYAVRFSGNGNADSTAGTNTWKCALNYSSLAGGGYFMNAFIINDSSKEKLVIGHTTENSSSGAGTTPNRLESAGKWANTSDQITSIQIRKESGAGGGQLQSGSFIKVWGSN